MRAGAGEGGAVYTVTLWKTWFVFGDKHDSKPEVLVHVNVRFRTWLVCGGYGFD